MFGLWWGLVWAAPCDDAATLHAEMPAVMDALDRAAWALRDVETVLVVQQAWAARADGFRAVGEATADPAVQARGDRAIRDRVDHVRSAGGVWLLQGETVGGVVLPDLVGLGDAGVAEGMAWVAEERQALAQARHNVVDRAEAFAGCGLAPYDDPGAALAVSMWAEALVVGSELHQVDQLRGALERVDHVAAAIDGALADVELSAAAAVGAGHGERVARQAVFDEAVRFLDEVAAEVSWAGVPLGTGVSWAGVELPDLSASGLGLDQAPSLKLSAPVAVEVVAKVRLEVAGHRAGYAEVLASLPSEELPVPPLLVDGAALAGDPDAVGDALAAYTVAVATMADWQEEATLREALLDELHGALLADDGEELDPWLAALAEDAPAVAVAVGFPGGEVVEVGLPELALSLGAAPTLADVQGAREAVAAARWEVAGEQALLTMHGASLAREAFLVGVLAPLVLPVDLPAPPPTDATDEALAGARAQARAVLDALDRGDGEVLAALRRGRRAVRAGEAGHDPGEVDAELERTEASVAGVASARWGDVPLFDGSLAGWTVPVGASGRSVTVALHDLRPDTLGVLGLASSAAPDPSLAFAQQLVRSRRAADGAAAARLDWEEGLSP